MEDLRLGRIAALVPEFAVKDLPLGRTLMMIYNLYVGHVAQAARRLATGFRRPGFDPGCPRGGDFSSLLVSRLVLESTQPPIK